ncbi:hypothetical protein D4764_10G0007690 [Takifugu flavidus]|uniref:Uncharacterized protein n=1 Tax=Takifugu flavidus TaxID=433684 RepID=A0A5C6PLE2_9TELE|nr:hypothetical protein D4764_10G0007690 [Takifugu flavidus]
MPVEPNWNHQHESEQKPAGSSVSIMRSSSMSIYADFNQPESSPTASVTEDYEGISTPTPDGSGGARTKTERMR